MQIRCIKCDVVKGLSTEELKEAGEFVEKRKLKAVGFLKILSLDLREPCTNGKEHVFEFEENFDKEIHTLAADVKTAKGVVKASEAEVVECERIIAEANARAELAKQRSIENGDKSLNLLEKMKEIAFIPDEELWT